ncbi:Uncharacterized alpha/beta hydrolase domain (DUF2235) domain containing protein [Elaphomyces granulatus]
MIDRESFCGQIALFGKLISCVVVELFRVENCVLLLRNGTRGYILRNPGKSYSRLPGGPSFVHSKLRGGIENAFQVLALQESRFHFQPLVWRQPSQEVNCNPRQCWFSGYHSDIGGGNEKEVLAHFALYWMMCNLKTFVRVCFQME